jgi:hypothetical protein
MVGVLALVLANIGASQPDPAPALVGLGRARCTDTCTSNSAIASSQFSFGTDSTSGLSRSVSCGLKNPRRSATDGQLALYGTPHLTARLRAAICCTNLACTQRHFELVSVSVSAPHGCQIFAKCVT